MRGAGRRTGRPRRRGRRCRSRRRAGARSGGQCNDDRRDGNHGPSGAPGARVGCVARAARPKRMSLTAAERVSGHVGSFMRTHEPVRWPPSTTGPVRTRASSKRGARWPGSSSGGRSAATGGTPSRGGRRFPAARRCAQRRAHRARRRRLRPARLLRLRHRHACHRRPGRRGRSAGQLPHHRAVLARPAPAC